MFTFTGFHKVIVSICFFKLVTGQNVTQQTCKIGPMLAISWQGRQNKFANALPMLPMFFQHLCKRRNYCSCKFPRIFSRLCNDSGPFSFTYSFPICQKYFFFITIQPTLVEYWLNIGCQHRHYAFHSANTGPTLDASHRPTLVDKIFLNYRQFFVINLGCSFQKC